jgi:hypothetical protein
MACGNVAAVDVSGASARLGVGTQFGQRTQETMGQLKLTIPF